MSLTINEHDCVSLRLKRARAILILIAQATHGGFDNSANIREAAYLADDLLNDVCDVLDATKKSKPSRAA
jgi:hypothetical protein